MTPTTKRSFLLLAAAATLVCVTSPTLAAGWPDRPVTFLVPFPAGGSSDVVARTVAQKASERLGQPIVIENRAGATGAIGATTVKRAPADGYTILVASIGVFGELAPAAARADATSCYASGATAPGCPVAATRRGGGRRSAVSRVLMNASIPSMAAGSRALRVMVSEASAYANANPVSSCR